MKDYSTAYKRAATPVPTTEYNPANDPTGFFSNFGAGWKVKNQTHSHSLNDPTGLIGRRDPVKLVKTDIENAAIVAGRKGLNTQPYYRSRHKTEVLNGNTYKRYDPYSDNWDFENLAVFLRDSGAYEGKLPSETKADYRQDLLDEQAQAATITSQQTGMGAFGEMAGTMASIMSQPSEILFAVGTGGTTSYARGLNILRGSLQMGAGTASVEGLNQMINYQNEEMMGIEHNTKQMWQNIALAGVGGSAGDTAVVFGGKAWAKLFKGQADDLSKSLAKSTPEGQEALRATRQIARETKAATSIAGDTAENLDKVNKIIKDTNDLPIPEGKDIDPLLHYDTDARALDVEYEDITSTVSQKTKDQIADLEDAPLLLKTVRDCIGG